MRHTGRLAFILLAFTILAAAVAPASAQTVVKLRASDPEVSAFPTIGLTLSLTDNNGRRIPGLESSNFTVLEDGVPIQGAEVTEALVGTRQIFVLNTSRSMRARDAFGMTRFDYVRESLLAWWSLTEASSVGLDDLTLITSEGPLIEHTTVVAEIASALYAFEPEYAEEPPSIDLLSQGLQYTNDPTPQPGMPTHIIFVTPLIFQPEQIPLADTITRAKANGITIFPVLVGPEEILDYPELDNLRLLAEETGGELIYYDSVNGLTALPERILSQRNLYRLSYRSHVNSSGSHRIQIQATQGNFDVLSNQQTFEIDLSAPMVEFLETPDKIIRQSDDLSLKVEALPPRSWPLEVQIMFPDGHLREITSSHLFVDDQIVSENLEPPFNQFVWNLESYSLTEQHVLQVLVEDTLGLQGFSSEIPISVEVVAPPSGLTAIQPAMGYVLTILGVIVVGLVLSVGIISFTRQRRAKKTTFVAPDRPGRKSQHRASLRQKLDPTSVEAKLEAVSPEVPSFHLVGTDIILGRDAALSAVHLDDPSVSGLHSRLTRLANGDYLIRDQDSIAGTWVNYTPVADHGTVLHHGDIIHVGRIQYRFVLAHPPRAKEIRVSPVNDEHELVRKSDPESIKAVSQ